MASALLSIPEVAARLRCSRGHVYNLIAAGALRAVDITVRPKSRSKTRVLETDLDAYIKSRTYETAAQRPGAA